MNWKNIVIFVLVMLLIAASGEKQMQFSDLLGKMANGEQLTPAEKDTLLLEARKMQETASLITSMVQPGTGTLKVDHFIANDAKITNAEILNAKTGDGDVTLDTSGIAIGNNTVGVFSILDSAGNRNKIYITADAYNRMFLVNEATPTADLGGIALRVLLTAGTTPAAIMEEDNIQANRSRFTVEGGSYGSRFVMEVPGNNPLIDFRTEGPSGGSTFMRMRETTATPDTAGNDAYHMYMKGDKLIVTSNGKFWYLDFTNLASQSWTYSATAP